MRAYMGAYRNELMGLTDAMVERDSGSLGRGKWLHALAELSLICSGSHAHETHERVRDMNMLLLLTPEGCTISGLRALASDRLATLLAVGAYETTVMAMLDRGAGFLLSRGGDGHSLATIALPGTDREISGDGATPALAMVCALASSLSAAAAVGSRLAAPSHPKGERVALH
jgi:hypothetical protein